MIRVANGLVFFSRTDLTEFVACDHLTQLSLAATLGERPRPFSRDAFAELIQRRGKEHEALREAGSEVIEIALSAPPDFVAGAEATRRAMEAGAAYIYQAVLISGRWRGVADFLERVASRPWRRSTRGWRLKPQPTKGIAVPRVYPYSGVVSA